MQEVPWYALSPSPFSILFYVILTVWGAKQLLKTKCYGKYKIQAFTSALFIVGFIVLIGDLTWCIVCALRFAYMFPSSMNQILFCIGRDIVGVVFCFLMIGNYFENDVLKLRMVTVSLLIINLAFVSSWFFFSDSPAWTDWTFALKYGYPLSTILASFLISHVIGKSLVAVTYYTIWRR